MSVKHETLEDLEYMYQVAVHWKSEGFLMEKDIYCVCNISEYRIGCLIK